MEIIFDLPDSGGLYKLLQIRVNGSCHFIFGPSEARHHFLLKNFLSRNGIDYSKVRRHNSSFLIPALSGKDYKVLGMGIAVVRKNEVAYGGKSEDYQIGLDKQLILEVKERKPEIKMFISKR